MKITRLHVLLLALSLTLVAYGAKDKLHLDVGSTIPSSTTSDKAALQMAAMRKARQEQPTVEAGPRPHGDGVLDGWFKFKSNYPRPVSAWQTNEKTFYTQLLLKEKYDVLVVPFQVQDRALDKATRSLLTTQLSEAVQSSGSVRVPDPYLVARALGDGDRRFNPDVVYSLAQQLKVHRIIWSYVGHDRRQHLALTLSTQDQLPNTDIDQHTQQALHSKDGLAFSNQDSPLLIAQTALNDLIKEIGYAPAPQQRDSGNCNAELVAPPESPFELMEKASNPAQLARSYELYSALTPDAEERTKRRFAEKAFLAVSQLSDACPSYRLLKARALSQLGFRPAALAVLANPQNPEEKALIEALNGNFPELDKLLHDISTPQAKLLPMLDLIDIGGSYRLINKQKLAERIASLKLPGKFWSFFIERKFADHDDWMVQDNRIINALLAHDLPVNGSAVGNLGADPDIALFEHSRKYWQENLIPKPDSASTKTRRFDYLDLLTAIGINNLFNQIDFADTVQGLPDAAMQRLQQISPVYKDHPRFAMERSIVELSLAYKNPAASVAANLTKAAYDDAMSALYWEQGQSPVSNEALAQVSNMNRTDYGMLINLYDTDLPSQSNYTNHGLSESQSFIQSAIEGSVDNSNKDTQPVRALVDWYANYDKAKLTPFLEQLKQRFHGSPDLASAMITMNKDQSSSNDTEALLRKAIADNPTTWQFYFDLGTLLFNQGKLDQASTLFLSYPSFKHDTGENPVGVTNHLGEVAMRFYHAGYFEQAAKFYQIADQLDTGSDYALVAHERLALMRGDLAAAQATLSDRVQRYGSNTAFFEFLSMLHATGQSKQAWDLSDGLIGAGKNSSLWGGAITGFRISGASESTIVNWARKLAVGSAMQQDAMNPGQFLMTAATFDRKPSAAVVEALDKIEVPVTAANDTPHTAIRQLDAEHGQLLYRFPNMACGGMIPRDFSSSPKFGKYIKSDRHYFVAAYRAMQAKDYAGAQKLFAEAGQLYDMTCPIVTYLDPYWAFAAAKNKDTAYLDNLLTLFHPDDRRFDFYLTKSVLQAFKNDINGSIESAHLAKLFVTNTQATGFLPDYSYAEIMEWLYFETKNEKYRSEVLAWVATVEKKFPWAGWAYAMEAELLTDPVARSNATAMAHYLDPLSVRLANLPKSVRDSAKFTNGNRLLRPTEREHRIGNKT